MIISLLTNIPIVLISLSVLLYFLTALLIVYVVRYKKGYNYFLECIKSLDQFANTLLFGDKNEYISTRAGRCAFKGYNRPCYWLCKILHVFDKDHCKKSVEADTKEALKQLESTND